MDVMSNLFLRSRTITHVWLDDCLVVLDTENGNYFSLNSSAAQFFLALNEESELIKGDLYVGAADDQLTTQLEEMLEPLPASSRVMIFDLLRNQLIKINPAAGESSPIALDQTVEGPSVSCWGTVSTNTLTGS
jgi:hypothetical protein